jgi:hypothetical protein
MSYDQNIICEKNNFEKNDFLTLYKGLALSIYNKINKNNKNFRKLYALCKPEDENNEDFSESLQ